MNYDKITCALIAAFQIALYIVAAKLSFIDSIKYAFGSFENKMLFLAGLWTVCLSLLLTLVRDNIFGDKK